MRVDVWFRKVIPMRKAWLCPPLPLSILFHACWSPISSANLFWWVQSTGPVLTHWTQNQALLFTRDHSRWLNLQFCGILVAQSVKSLPARGDPSSIPGSERSPGKGNGNPLQYSCLGNPMDRGAWWATIHGVARVRQNLATKPTYL